MTEVLGTGKGDGQRLVVATIDYRRSCHHSSLRMETDRSNILSPMVITTRY